MMSFSKFSVAQKEADAFAKAIQVMSGKDGKRMFSSVEDALNGRRIKLNLTWGENGSGHRWMMAIESVIGEEWMAKMSKEAEDAMAYSWWGRL